MHSTNTTILKEYEKYCLDNDIMALFSEPLEIQKNSIVERFNKTLAGYIKKIREAHLMENYNNQYHRTIRNKIE